MTNRQLHADAPSPASEFADVNAPHLPPSFHLLRTIGVYALEYVCTDAALDWMDIRNLFTPGCNVQVSPQIKTYGALTGRLVKVIS